ncbi:MAG TPA: flippase-like domain-containing protein [Anaerolineae bacterium]|nr:flippase-like domain-containing protein [Anaerolineae bacterium]
MGQEEGLNLKIAFRQRGRLIIGMVLSLVCLFLVFRGVRFAEVEGVLARTDYLFLTAAVALSIANYITLAIRWRILFYPHHMPQLHGLFSGLMVAQLANTILPVRLSPIIRALWVSGVEDIDKAFVFSTVVFEKILDGLTFLFVMGLLLLLVPLPQWLWDSGLSVGIICLALFLWLLLMARYRDKVLDVSTRVVDSFPLSHRLRLSQAVRSALSSLDVWREKDKVLQLWGWSIAVWGIPALLNYCTMLALHIHAPFIAALVLLVILQAGIRIPSSLGNIGVFYYLSVLSLSLFSIDKATAVSYGIVLHLLNFLPQSLLGVVYLWQRSSRVRKGLPWALSSSMGDPEDKAANEG